jgi:hypothetical protein
MFVAESFAELADDTVTNQELAIFALQSAQTYAMQIAKNILAYLKKRSAIEEGAPGPTCLPLEASLESLAKELGVHLSSLISDRSTVDENGAVHGVDSNHDDLDLNRQTRVIYFDPMQRNHRLVVQEGVRRSDGGSTFKVVIAEKRVEHGYRISSAYLVGRDSTGQHFLSRLPPQYEFDAIDACERWIFGMREDDVLVKEA